MAALRWQPVEPVTHLLRHASSRRKPQDEASRRAHHGLLTVERTRRRIAQDTVTIVQSTAEHRADERLRGITRQSVSGQRVATAGCIADGRDVVDMGLEWQVRVNHNSYDADCRQRIDDSTTNQRGDLRDTVPRIRVSPCQMSSVFDALSRSRLDAFHSLTSSLHAGRQTRQDRWTVRQISMVVVELEIISVGVSRSDIYEWNQISIEPRWPCVWCSLCSIMTWSTVIQKPHWGRGGKAVLPALPSAAAYVSYITLRAVVSGRGVATAVGRLFFRQSCFCKLIVELYLYWVTFLCSL